MATMTQDKKAVFGVFRRGGEVISVADQLEREGFSPSDISTMNPEHRGPQDFSQRQGTHIVPFAMIGAAIGGLIFMVVGIVLCLRMTSISFLQAEPTVLNQMLFVMASIIAGAFLGAASGALVGIGTPRPASTRYGNYVDAGGILMSVHVDDEKQSKLAEEDFKKFGGQDVAVLNEQEGWKKAIEKTDAPRPVL